MEVWRDVVGFEGVYVVSNIGRVMRVCSGRGVKPGTVKNPSKTCCGYLTVTLSHNGEQTTRSVHRLVADAFLGPRPEGREVNHKNGDKQDNRPENLEWVTRSENLYHSFGVLGRRNMRGAELWFAKLKEDDIPEIKALYAGGMSQRKIGAKYGVSQVMIHHIIHGVWWKHVR